MLEQFPNLGIMTLTIPKDIAAEYTEVKAEPADSKHRQMVENNIAKIKARMAMKKLLERYATTYAHDNGGLVTWYDSNDMLCCALQSCEVSEYMLWRLASYRYTDEDVVFVFTARTGSLIGEL